MRRAMACGVKPALDDLRLEQEVKDELAKLAKDLLVLQTYLRDAENKQQTNETVRLWLGNLQDVAYDANDVLDECALKAQRQKVIVLAQLRKSVSLINPKRSLFLHKVSRRERKIKERMEELQRQRQAYGLKIIEQESPPHRSESTSLGPPEIIGRDEDKANLKELLKKLRGKKFLLVLDDVWIEDWRQWHKFRTPLLQGCTGFEFEEEELVRLWMSQSFIQPYDQDLRMEDVGRTYFDLLKQRSFFQFSRFDQKNNRSKYTIPESLHKYVRRGRRIAEHGNGFAKNRHLSLMPQEKPSLFNRQSVNDQLKGLYTLVIFDDSVTELPDDFTKKFERLRALDLSHTGIHKLPDSIHHLKHLRCLQLGGTNITRLPDALCCLYFLQTLGLQNCSMLEELPKEMKYLQCLRHIDLHWDHDSLMAPGHIPRFVVSEKKRCGVEELGNMTSLHGELLVSNLQLVRDAADAKAANLEGKEHLQCLELQWNAVDKEAAKFRRDLFGRDSVENLDSAFCCQSSATPFRALRKFHLENMPSLHQWHGDDRCVLNSLRELIIKDCSNFQKISHRMPYLEKLVIKGSPKLASLPVLPNLNSLTVSRNGRFFWQLLPPLTSLFSLRLKGLGEAYLHQGSLRGLNSLQRLEIVSCYELIKLPEDWQHTNLVYLGVKHCPKLRFLPDELGKFGALQDLEIQRCPSLSSLPEQFGFMKSLERLEISDCPSLLAMPSSFAHLASRLEHKQLPLAQGTVQGGEDDWPKIKNVFSVWVDGDVILPCRRT
ncbi:hypothetical protein HPP92_008320 [Vanilla planifolia]|uniref:Uncharacterized protein n=2 Tax=Vanilla planifolia TaxID=51239 RepID=A0A835RDW0_VANPL|nr:hypothetical protein HPP92_008320 [Vanilla planifolia]